MTGRRRGMLVAGIVVLVAGVVGAVVLWIAADTRYDDNVAAFARAPVGCDTTLDFDRTGEFVLYIETTGTVEGIGGDCDVTERYDRDPDGLPRPELTLRDPDGESLPLEETGGVDYDTGAFVGTAYRLVDIERPGDHVLTVGAVDGDAFAMAIGGDPKGGVALLRWSALASLLAGAVAGGILLVLGSRRTAEPEPTASPWAPTTTDHAAWPLGPPGFPAPPPTTGAVAPPGPSRPAPPSSPPDSASTSPPTEPPSASPPWSPPSVR